MRPARVVALLGLLAAGGCWPDHAPAPEEVALDRFDEGERLFAAGRYAAAAAEYEYALNHRWRWKAPYVKLAACHEKSGRPADAVSVLERLLQVDGDDEDALRGLGRLYDGRGDAPRALLHYRKLRTLHPDDRTLDGVIARLEALGRP